MNNLFWKDSPSPVNPSQGELIDPHGKMYAIVLPHRGVNRKITGWYWISTAGYFSVNTINCTPTPTYEAAKKSAESVVKKHWVDSASPLAHSKNLS